MDLEENSQLLEGNQKQPKRPMVVKKHPLENSCNSLMTILVAVMCFFITLIVLDMGGLIRLKEVKSFGGNHPIIASDSPLKQPDLPQSSPNKTDKQAAGQQQSGQIKFKVNVNQAPPVQAKHKDETIVVPEDIKLKPIAPTQKPVQNLAANDDLADMVNEGDVVSTPEEVSQTPQLDQGQVIDDPNYYNEDTNPKDFVEPPADDPDATVSEAESQPQPQEASEDNNISDEDQKVTEEGKPDDTNFIEKPLTKHYISNERREHQFLEIQRQFE